MIVTEPLRSRPRHSAAAAPLVEGGQAGGQVGGVALFPRHLLQAGGDLPQGLGPAGRGVHHDRRRVAHVAEVLGDRDPHVDRGFPGGHGHVGGVDHQHGAVHQGPARAGVGQLGELGEHVGHLVAPLTAAHVHDHVRGGELGQGLLQHGLAGAEAPRQAGGAAQGDGEEGVQDALPGDERLGEAQLAPHRPRHLGRPPLGHAEESAVLQQHHRLLHRVRAAPRLPDRSPPARRRQDAVGETGGFLHGAQHVPRAHLLAGPHRRLELPAPVARQRRRRSTPGR